MHFKLHTIITVGSTLGAFANPLPANSTRNVDCKARDKFYPGTCCIHVEQHQRNEYGVQENFRFTVEVYDDQRYALGGVFLKAAPEGVKTPIDCDLPKPLKLTASQNDDDAVQFTCGDSSSFDGGFGGYDYGNRKGDFTFYCAPASSIANATEQTS